MPGAVDLYARASASYPASDLASRAALRSGLTQFRLQDVSGAAASFQRAGELAQVGADRAAAAYWSGKVLASQGLTAESEQAWASAAANDPTGFYSERAADVLAGRGPFEPAGVFSFPIDLGGDRSQAEEWLRTTFPITAAGDLSGLNESSAGDPRMVRGTELLALGFTTRRGRSSRICGSTTPATPSSTYRLMHRFLALGLYDAGHPIRPPGARPGRVRRRRDSLGAPLLQPDPFRAVFRRPDFPGSGGRRP